MFRNIFIMPTLWCILYKLYSVCYYTNIIYLHHKAVANILKHQESTKKCSFKQKNQKHKMKKNHTYILHIYYICNCLLAHDASHLADLGALYPNPHSIPHALQLLSPNICRWNYTFYIIQILDYKYFIILCSKLILL